MPARVAALGLFAAVVAVSCGGVPKTYYYTLRVPPPPATSDPKTNFVLGVEHFRAAEMLRDDRIVFYKSPTEVDYYEHHRWSTDPATMMTELAARWLDQMGIFSEVRLLPSREGVDYKLAGRVLNFEEVDSEGETKGRVALRLTLVRTRDQKVVWTFVRQSEHPAEDRGMAGVVKALDASNESLLREALGGVAAQVEQDFDESQQHPE